MSDAPKRFVPVWLAGMTFLPFGLVVGFAITALPYLLTKAGVTVDRVAEVSAAVMSPTFWAFLITPIVDTGLSRRTWALVLGLASAVAMTFGVWSVSADRIPQVTALLLTGELAIVLSGAALLGLISEFVPGESRGRVGGWLNAANLGGGALGSMLLMELAAIWPLWAVGLSLGLLIVLTSLLVLVFPSSVASTLRPGEMITGTLRNVWRVSKQRESLVGLTLFLAPASAVAAINLFAGLGNDFHASSQQVIWVTGAGCAIAASIGSIVGGFIADRVTRGYMYLMCGMGAAVVATIMAFSSRSFATFAAGALAYNLAAGLSYAAFTALELDLTGENNPSASTQLTLFSCSTNLAIVYMTWLDGRGYKTGGARGLLLTDALASFCAAIPLLFLVRWALRRRTHVVAAQSST